MSAARVGGRDRAASAVLAASLFAVLATSSIAARPAAAAQPPAAAAAPPPAAPPAPPAAPPAAPAPAAAPAPRPAEVRLAVSPAAAKALSELRLRRLLELEVEDVASLAPALAGPLGDHVAFVWVDLPTPGKVVIEVRVGEHPVARREIAVLGLASGVAARLVTIGISELVHAQVQPAPQPAQQPTTPRAPTADELDRAARRQPALILTPAGTAAFIPQSSAVLGGPGLGVGFRAFGLSETLYGRWLTGVATDAGAMRWLEVGLSAEYRLWLHPAWRLSFGGSAALASVHLGDAMGVDGVLGERSTWSARAGGSLGVEARIRSPVWIGLSVEPGAMLRPLHFEAAGGARGTIEGFWIGLNLSLQFEWVQSPAAPGARPAAPGERRPAAKVARSGAVP